MIKILLLSFANIRKTKGLSVSMFIMFFLAALLLNSGLLILFNFSSFFKSKVQELNTSDTYYVMQRDMYTSKVKSFLENNANIVEKQEEDVLVVKSKTVYADDLRDIKYILSDADHARRISKWKFVGEHLPADQMSIYLPYIFHVDGGYDLDDSFELKLDNVTLSFTIKGFVEDIFFCFIDSGMLSGYLPHDTFEFVETQLNHESSGVLIYSNQKSRNSDIKLELGNLIGIDLRPSSGDTNIGLKSVDKSLIELSRVMLSSLISIMIVVFAAIIALVCLIVVRFRIVTSIIDDMSKIGFLKAIGYTSKQIIKTIIAQYLLIALLGAIGGIAASYRVLPVLSNAFAVQSGLKWEQGFDGILSFMTLGIVLFITLVVAYHSSMKINRLNPIVALRKGVITHSFKKNQIPLDKTKGMLPFILAIKSLLQNKKQSIMISIILITVSFAGSFAVILFYNTAVDTSVFVKIPGIELSNVTVTRNSMTDPNQLMEDMLAYDSVRKVQYIDQVNVMIERNEAYVYVMEDFNERETNSVYEGRYPLHSNEIVLPGVLAKRIHKSIGDKVEVTIRGNEEEYIVTGLSQGTSRGGMIASIRFDGMKRIHPDYEPYTLHIYLKDKVKSAEFIEMVNTSYKKEVMLIDMDKSLELGMGVYTDIVTKIGIVVLLITGAVVILVLYFVLNTSIARRKRDLGIQKSIGFTTFQLMNQMTLTFLPPVIIGVVIGNILGTTQINSLMSIAQRAMGIMKTGYIVKPIWIALFGCGIVILSYGTSMLITSRIRKISAYALLCE